MLLEQIRLFIQKKICIDYENIIEEKELHTVNVKHEPFTSR